MNTLNLDGIPFEMSDQAIAAVRKLEGQRNDAIARAETAEASVATLTTDKSTLEAENVTLQTQLDNSKLSPQQLRDEAKKFQGIVDKAKALGVPVTDAMDSAAIVKACVAKHVGDASKDWNDAQFDAAFATLKTDARQPVDQLRQVLTDGATVVADTSAIRDAAFASRYVN